ncbi:MAG: hypothetical protein ACYDBJ_20180 [Aggregatilineales bacterium]
MKFGKRLGLLAATAALCLTPAIGSLAQGMTCTLAAADCTTLATADTNAAKETSFAMEFEFSLDIKGDSPASAQATGTGQFAVAPNTSTTDPTAMANGIQLSLDAKGSGKGANSGSGAVSLVVTNGVLYFKTDKQDWQGVKLADAIKLGQAQMAGGAGGFGGGASASAGAAQMAQMFSDPDVMSALSSISNIKGFITLEKTSNSPQLEGQNMSEFVETISPAALLSSPDFATALKTIYAAVQKMNPGAAPSGGMNPDQITAMMPMVGSMIGDTNLKITRWVGQTDNMYHALGLDLNLNVNPGVMGGKGTATTGTVHFLIKLTKVGQPVTVAAPAGAKMIDLSAMMGGAGALSGGGAVGGSGAAASPTP